MTAPEFSRTVPLDRIGSAAARHEIAATPQECAALARRFGLVAIAALSAEIALQLRDGAVMAEGRVRGSVTQSCVASGEPVVAQIDAPLAIRFVAAGQATPEEIELDADDCDEMPLDGQAVDLGEAAAQTLALALDPYPRAPTAEEALKAAGVIDETRTGPFAALDALLRK